MISMDNMNKGIVFNFSKVRDKLTMIKTLKEVFCLSLREAKDAVDCGTYFHNLSDFSYKNDAIKFYNTIFDKIARLINEDCSDVIKFVWKENKSNSNSQNIQEINLRLKTFKEKKKRVFDWTRSYELTELTGKVAKETNADALTNVDFKIKHGFSDYLNNVFTVGLAQSTTLEITGDAVKYDSNSSTQK